METRPYWFNADLPTFPTLDRDMETDVVVIGGGLTGITAAHLFKSAGAKVVLLERERCASADTGHTTAHLTYVTDTRLHKLVKTFGREAAKAVWDGGAVAIDQIYDLVRTENIDCGFQWVPGYLHARLGRTSNKDVESLRKDADLAVELGFRAQFLDRVPYLNRPGVRFFDQAKFHPREYLAGLLQRLPGEGTRIFENSAVSEVRENPLVVRVGEHTVHCQYVVIATHCPIMGNTNLVSATLFQTKLALYTSYVVGAKLPPGTAPEALFWDTSDPYYYLRVDRHPDYDYVIFGGEDCKTGQEQDSRAVFDRLEQSLMKIAPGAHIEQHWLGQVVETNDGLPFIGETGEAQFVATGFCGNGFTLGTLAAMMARDRFLGKTNPWFELLDVSRRKVRGGSWRYVTENVDYPYYLLRDRLAGAEVDSVDAVQPNQGKIVKANGKKAAAFRDETGTLTLRSPVCTHLGCIVRWNGADKTWDCPCHGSRFKPTGEVFSGPAEEPLAKFPE